MMALGSIFANWQRDERGTMTVEFLLWMPILSFWLVVSTALYDAYKSRRHASNAVHVMSDIMSRQVEVTDSFASDLYMLQAKLLPNAPPGAQGRVTTIQYLADDDTYQVLWSMPVGGGEMMTNDEIPLTILPEMADFDTVIVTELAVPYQPFTHWAKIEVTEWSFAVVSRPRYVSAVAMLANAYVVAQETGGAGTSMSESSGYGNGEASTYLGQ